MNHTCEGTAVPKTKPENRLVLIDTSSTIAKERRKMIYKWAKRYVGATRLLTESYLYSNMNVKNIESVNKVICIHECNPDIEDDQR
jgi:hypothetical protein